MENCLTNQQDTTHFTVFLSEALPWVDAWTPTEINSGGCGAFALELSAELTKYGIEHTVCVLYQKGYGKDQQYEESLEKAKNTLNYYVNNHSFKKREKLAFDHICVKMHSLYLDSTGILNNTIHTFDVIEIPEESLKGLMKEDVWNEIFDRACITTIKNKLDEVFEHYDTFEEGCLKFPTPDEVPYTAHTRKELRERNPFFNLSTILG